MGVEIVSKIGKSNTLDYQLYSFLIDFNNIKNLLPPDQKEKFECTKDTCTIRMNKMATLHLEIVDKDPNKLIKLGNAGAGKDFFIWIQLKQVASYDTRIRITIKAKMNMLMKMMAKKQLQKFADQFVDGLCAIPAQVLQYQANYNS